MSKIQLNAASGGGSVAIEGPASLGSDKIIKIPNSHGFIVQTIMSSGSTSTGTVSCNNKLNYFDIPNMTVTITPTSSTSKIMVSFSAFGEGSVEDHRIGFRIKRAISGGSTDFIQGAASGICSQFCTMPATGYHAVDKNSTPAFGNFGPYLDSPSTTSAITYTVQVRLHEDNTGTWSYNRVISTNNAYANERGVSFITVAEVSA